MHLTLISSENGQPVRELDLPSLEDDLVAQHLSLDLSSLFPSQALSGDWNPSAIKAVVEQEQGTLQNAVRYTLLSHEVSKPYLELTDEEKEHLSRVGGRLLERDNRSWVEFTTEQRVPLPEDAGVHALREELDQLLAFLTFAAEGHYLLSNSAHEEGSTHEEEPVEAPAATPVVETPVEAEASHGSQ